MRLILHGQFHPCDWAADRLQGTILHTQRTDEFDFQSTDLV